MAKKLTDKPTFDFSTVSAYLHNMWSNMEEERTSWEVERTEFEAKIMLLQKERTAQESLKQDLVRRIKMLEHALLYERSKNKTAVYERLADVAEANGTCDISNVVSTPHQNGSKGLDISGVYDDLNENAERISSEVTKLKDDRRNFRLLLTDLEFSGFMDEQCNARVKEFLDSGSLKPYILDEYETPAHGVMNSATSLSTKPEIGDYSASPLEYDTMLKDTIYNTNPEELNDESAELVSELDHLVYAAEMAQSGTPKLHEGSTADERNAKQPSSEDTNSIRSTESSDAVSITSVAKRNISDYDNNFEELAHGIIAGKVSPIAFSCGEVTTEKQLSGVGSFAANPNVKTSISSNAIPKRQWSCLPKSILRGHFDNIYALQFHSTESLLLSASEDQTLKLWNLNKPVQASRRAMSAAACSNTAYDIEAVYTFRGHSSPVLSLVWDALSNISYSGGLDGSIMMWNVPPATVDPFEKSDPNINGGQLLGHTDAVWSLSLKNSILLSASADKSIRVWSHCASAPISLPFSSATFYSTDCVVNSTPTAVCHTAEESAQAIIGYSTGNLSLLDFNAGKIVTRFEDSPCYSLRTTTQHQVNSLAYHSSSLVCISGHEDKQIRFFDIRSGRLIRSKVANLDAISSLSLDKSGTYLLTSSYDGSLRVWHYESMNVVHEIRANQRRLDAGIYAAALHSSKLTIACSTPDNLIRIYA